jgi:Sap, sulfolipid-1-addressing protein
VSHSSASRKWFLALELALGTLLIIIWLRRRFRPRAPKERAAAAKPEPAWQRRIATMGYGGAFVLGGLTQTWPVMIAAGVEVATLDISVVSAMAWIIVFAIATTAGVVVLEVLAIRSPGTAASRLDRIRRYVDDHRDSVINWAYLFGGLVLGYRGLIGLF